MLPYLNHRTRAPGNSYHKRKPCSLHSMKKKASHSVNYKIFVCTYMYVYSAVGSNIDSSFYQNFFLRASLAVQWLRLHASNAGDMGWIPGRGTKIPHASRCSKKKKPKYPFISQSYLSASAIYSPPLPHPFPLSCMNYVHFKIIPKQETGLPRWFSGKESTC